MMALLPVAVQGQQIMVILGPQLLIGNMEMDSENRESPTTTLSITYITMMKLVHLREVKGGIAEG